MGWILQGHRKGKSWVEQGEGTTQHRSCASPGAACYLSCIWPWSRGSISIRRKTEVQSSERTYTAIQLVRGTAQVGTQKISSPCACPGSLVSLWVTLTLQRAAPLLHPLTNDPDAACSLVQTPHSLIPNLGEPAVRPWTHQIQHSSPGRHPGEGEPDKPGSNRFQSQQLCHWL